MSEHTCQFCGRTARGTVETANVMCGAESRRVFACDEHIEALS